MTVTAAAAIPAAPLLLPAASPNQPDELAPAIDELRGWVTAALRSVPPRVDAIVLLASGPDLERHDATAATLTSYGMPGLEATISTDTSLLEGVTGAPARVGTHGVDDGRLHGDLAVLALQVLALAPSTVLVPVTVPGQAPAGTLAALADRLVAAVPGDREVVVLACGDLSATRDVTSPGYVVDGAVEWDEAAAAAVSACDPEALGRLGPDEAARVVARGWAPLVVLLHVARAAGLRIGTVRTAAPRGVGQLVAF